MRRKQQGCLGECRLCREMKVSVFIREGEKGSWRVESGVLSMQELLSAVPALGIPVFAPPPGGITASHSTLLCSDPTHGIFVFSPVFPYNSRVS